MHSLASLQRDYVRLSSNLFQSAYLSIYLSIYQEGPCGVMANVLDCVSK